MNKSQQLKDLLVSKETLVMPDAYDPISARIIEQAGFKAVQCSGFSFSVAACKKQEVDIGLEANVAITARIVEAVSVPVMADGEDGFGDIEQIPNTIERYVKIGTAGINLEDQILDRKPEELVKGIHGPLSIAAGLANNLQAFSINDLKELGVARVSLPSIAISASVKALLQAMEALKSGVFRSLIQEGRLCSSQDFGRLIGA